LSFSVNYLDPYRLFAVGALIASLALLALHARYEDGAWHVEPLTLLLATIVVGALLVRIPEYAYGHSVNGLVHRSLFTAFLLLAVALPRFARPCTTRSVRRPLARDTSRYPILALPAAFAAFGYALILARLFQKGWDGLSWHAVHDGVRHAAGHGRRQGQHCHRGGDA